MLVTPSISAERAAFLHEIGYALNQWAHVEQQLQRLCESCVPPVNAQVIAVGFRAIETFKPRIQFTDQLLRQKLAGSDDLKNWESLKNRGDALSTKRNKLAHYPSKLFPNGKRGRRIALIPWLPQKR